MIEFVTSDISDSAILVQLGGDLRESSRSYFFDCMGDLIESGISDIVIECNKLGFISSSGLAALLVARRKATKKGCRIYFTHVSSTLSDLLEVTKLGQFFSVYATTEEAIARIQNKSLIADARLQLEA